MGSRGSGKLIGSKSQRKIHPLSDEFSVYERQPDETDQAWAAFVAYRDMENRSIVKAMESVGKSNQSISMWSVVWSWRLRVEAWDREIDRRKRDATLQEVEDMRRRQLQLAKSVQGFGAQQLQKLIEEGRASGKSTLTADQVIKLIAEGIKLERLNMNEPGEISERRDPIRDEKQIRERIEHLLKARKK